MKPVLKNDYLTVAFKEIGGELTSIKDASGVEYLWQGDSAYWGGQAPVLFPICGSVRDNVTIFEDGTKGTIPRHGLVRKLPFQLEEVTDNKVVYLLESTEDMLANYPYPFELRIVYTLDEKTIHIAYHVTNKSENLRMPYVIGAHPGFNCPLVEGESYEDYYLEFEQEETCSVPRSYPETGLLDINDRTAFLNHQTVLELDYALFSHDAVTLDQLQSRSVSLKSRKTNKGIKVGFKDLPNLIIWSTLTKGPFIALEPWGGLSNSLEDSDNFIDKTGITMVEAGQTSTKLFDITILDCN